MKRIKCLAPSELAYLLLISSVITGCTSQVQRLPNYKEALDLCKKDPDYCRENEKLNQQFPNHDWSKIPQIQNGEKSSEIPSFWNYYLLYHLLFSSSPGNSAPYQNHFTIYDQTKMDEDRKSYSGHGVYSPRYVSRMRSAVEDGKISYATDDGYIYRSSQSLGKSTSSLTGKVISRGGFGSRGRAMGVSS